MPTEQLQSLERAAGVAADELVLADRTLPRVAPPNEEALVETVAWARATGRSLLPLGAGSWIANHQAPATADVAVSTRGLTGVVAYEPGDGTVTARAGTRLSELRTVTREGQHSLTPDVAHPDRSTLGGVVASGRSGFDRLRRGPLRHHLLGTRVLLADGSVAQSGGRLVKNVTGYDLHRLYCGSRGALCLILEASLRLFPRPEEERRLTLSTSDTAAALRAARDVLAERYDPVAVRVQVDPEPQLEVFLAGRSAVLDAQVDELQTRFPEAQVSSQAGPRRRELRDAPARPALVAGCRPSQVAALVTEFDRARARLGSSTSLCAHPGLAEVELRAAEDLAAGELADLAAGLKLPSGASLRSEGGWALAPAGQPAGLPLMQRLRDALDPNGVFARGRFGAEL